jgi:hypothetical protein
MATNERFSTCAYAETSRCCKKATPTQIKALLPNRWAFAHCILCVAAYIQKRGDLSPYALLGRFLPRLKAALRSGLLFLIACFYRTIADPKSGESRFNRLLPITLYVGATDPFVADISVMRAKTGIQTKPHEPGL